MNDEKLVGIRTGEINSAYSILRQELKDAAYSGMDNAAAAAAINAKTVSGRAPIAGADVLAFFIRNGIVGAARIFAETQGGDLQLRGLCQTVCDSFAFNTFTTFDLDDPAAKADSDAFTGALIAAGCMTPDHQTELYAMADTATPWTVAMMGLPHVSEYDVQAAKDMP